MGGCVDEVACGLGWGELEVDGEGGGGEEAVEDCAGFEACGSRGYDFGVAPDRHGAVGVRVVVGGWKEVWYWEGVPPIGHCS